MRGPLYLGKPMAEKEPPTVESPPNKKGGGARHIPVADKKSSQVYVPWMVILGDHGIKKISFRNFDI